jgi:ATP-dependent Clp protease, protease subunit
MFNKLKLLKRKSKLFPTISSYVKDGGTVWIISIRGEINSPEYYTNACNVILNATENDTVIISLNTPGGHVYSGLAIINAIENSKATIITRAIGMVASCGAFIWGCGHKLEMCKFSRLMFHASSGGFIGKTRDQKENAEAIEKLIKEYIIKIKDRNILSDKQFEDMFESRQDVYLTTVDLENNKVEFDYA